MTARFLDLFDPAARYVRETGWKGALNCWRVDSVNDDGTVNLTNVSDWRGLGHLNVEDFRECSLNDARAFTAEGLRIARRDHRNYMRRTVAARREGTEDGRAAGTWAVDGNTSEVEAINIVRALDDGTFFDGWETDYPQTFAHNDELWDAYVTAYDTALVDEIERSARALIRPTVADGREGGRMRRAEGLAYLNAEDDLRVPLLALRAKH